METRANVTGFWRRQPTKGRQPPRKVQKPGQTKARSSKEQRSVSTISPPLTSATHTRRPGVVVPVIKPMTANSGKIPPFNPNAVKKKTQTQTLKANAVPVKKVRTHKQPLAKKINRSRKTRLKPLARTMLYAMRLLIVGVGIGAIVGTALSIFDPATRITPNGSQSNATVEQAQPQPTPNHPDTTSGLSLSQENTSLKTALQNLVASYPNLTPGVFFVDLESGSYVDLNASSNFPAASTIKLPVIVALLQDVDAGKIRLDETITLRREMIVGGSGDLQYKRVGTQFTILELATKMITVSDNTAANMLITRLGGKEVLNPRFQSWGLTTTAIRNPLPDLQGTNSTSPKDLANLMAMINKGNLVSTSSRDRLLDIMRHTVRNQLLPSGLEPGVTIAHKTGDIGTMLADVGLVDLPSGKHYIISVMVQRPNNDIRAEKLISSISRTVYQQFSPSTTTPNSTASTAPSTGYQSPVVTPSLRSNTSNTIPNNSYQSSAVTPSLRSNISNTIPNTGYQPPVISPPQYNITGSTIPNTGYQPPVITPPQYNMTNTMPMPTTVYQPPQYYYPYQR